MPTVVCTKSNPRMLSWARRSVNVSVEQAAKRLRVEDDHYKDIEQGAQHPTLSQLRKLALLYKRPLAVFFMAEPPADAKKPTDFRSHDGELTKKTLLSIRRARYIQKNYKLLLDETVKSPALWRNADDVAATAELARNWLGLTDEKQLEVKDSKELFSLLVERLQERNILVLLHSFPITDAKAYCFPEEPRVIVISTGDKYTEGRLFSLLHELTHLAAGDSGICLVQESYNQPIKERFCDQVAAHALMPESLVRSVIAEYEDVELLDNDTLSSIARTIKCSKLALLFRLVELKYITQQQCEAKRKEWAKTPVKKQGGGRTNRISTALRENGTAYTATVINSYNHERITASEAARLLNINQAYIEQVGARIGKT
jgi:Zn-dependent peptidase ImmA (M78 family)